MFFKKIDLSYLDMLYIIGVCIYEDLKLKMNYLYEFIKYVDYELENKRIA